MSWSSLPDDMVELVFAKLSLVELARISPICSSFQARYLERMALQQKSRSNLAFNLCGPERIACIIALIAHLLLGRPLRRDICDCKDFTISADGVLHDGGPYPEGRTFDLGYLLLYISKKKRMLTFEFPPVEPRRWLPPGLWVEIRRKGVVINVCPIHDEDLEPVAMVQAMLSGGLAQFLHHSGKRAEINIWECCGDVTAAGLKAQIIPLLSFASRYRREDAYGNMPADGHWEDPWMGYGERMQVGVVGFARRKGMVSCLRGRAGRLVGPLPQYDLLRHVVREGHVEWLLRGSRSLLTRLRGGRQNP